METIKQRILLASLFVGISTSLFFAVQKIMHKTVPIYIFYFSCLCLLTFAIMAIFEIMQSQFIPKHEKIMWVVGIIISVGLVGFIYVRFARKRVLGLNEN
jgi:uncharacterized membrane protein